MKMDISKNEQHFIEYITQITDVEELSRLNKMLNTRFNQIEEMKAIQFTPGDKVTWDSPRAGEIKRDVITKINRKTATVQTENGERWRVTASLLSKDN